MNPPDVFRVNPDCPDRGVADKGNIKVHSVVNPKDWTADEATEG
jgi:hypothetical protein